jgi:hypothetical protein
MLALNHFGDIVVLILTNRNQENENKKQATTCGADVPRKE